MFNRTVWLVVALFWGIVWMFGGWQGVVIIGAFSVCIMVVVLLTERSVKHD